MIFLGMEPLETSLRIATVVVPVSLYFLLLGLLNSRRHPQLLSGRQDFALLMVALSPLAFGPAMHYLNGGLWMVPACVVLLIGGIWALAPRGRVWVIYNLPLSSARQTVIDAFEAMGRCSCNTVRGVEVEQGKAFVEFSSFPLLRNVSLRLVGGDEDLWRTFESHLSLRLKSIETTPSPMAVSLLLIATAMIVAPMALMVHHAPEIVRILTDLF